MKKFILFEHTTGISHHVECRPDDIEDSDVYEVEHSDTGFYKKLENGDIISATPEDLEKVSLVLNGIDDAKIKLIEKIKNECREKILTAYPYWRQLNLLSDGGSALEDMKIWINNYRARSDTLESEVTNISDLRAIIDFEINWEN